MLIQFEHIQCLFFIHIAPSSPPLNLSIIIEGPSSITLDWLPPPFDGQNGIIRSYDILIREVVTGNEYNETTQNTTISIKYLHPNYEYNIKVRAVTILSGKTSDAITILTPEDGKQLLHYEKAHFHITYFHLHNF